MSQFPPAQPAESQPVAVHYCATFLKPEMLHIYRQITACREFQPVVFAQKRESTERFPFERVVLIPKPRTHQLRRFWFRKILRKPILIYESEARRLAAELKNVGADVLHVYFGHIGIYLLPLLRRRLLPTVISFHGADVLVDLEKEAHREALREVLELVDLVLVRSKSLAGALCLIGADSAKIRLHRTGIPLKQYSFRTPAPPQNGRWKLVQACRLIPKKGVDTAIRAAALFFEKFPEAELVVAGEGPERKRLVKLAEDLGVSNRVRWTGFLPQAELETLFREAHVFLHPSEIGPDGNQEGVPNSMLEAMATGLPVIATRHGGIPEAISSGETGILVDEKDDRALANELIRLAENRDLLMKLGTSGAEFVRENFAQEKQVLLLQEYYREAIARFGVSGPGRAV